MEKLSCCDVSNYLLCGKLYVNLDLIRQRGKFFKFPGTCKLTQSLDFEKLFRMKTKNNSTHLGISRS